ncbi:MAG: hypothetical protein D3924_06345 [Candidatus Electrothrix sp. AR4]|nr:hypothetical protein [Candidatus Electrothrix sp. AR4]
MEFDIDTNSVAIGFVLDTAPTDQLFFNYRLNIGFEGQEIEDDFNRTLDVNGVIFENVFGFAFVQRQDFRWWAGPLVHIGINSGDRNTHDDAGIPYKDEYEFFQFGFGGITGVNFKVGDHVTLAPSIGFRFFAVSGTGTLTNLNTNVEYEEDLLGGSTSCFVNLAVLF